MSSDTLNKITEHRWTMIFKTLAEDGIAGKMLKDSGEGPKVLRKVINDLVAAEKGEQTLLPKEFIVKEATRTWDDYLALRAKNVVERAA